MGAEPLTVAVTREFVDGNERTADAWLRKVVETASAFDGHQGASILRHSRDKITLLFRFASVEHLSAWEKSRERARLLEEIAPISKSVHVQEIEGLEPFFSLPDAPGAPPPAKWKMAVVTWAVAFPLIQLFQATLGAGLTGLPPLARGALVGAAMVATMTWFAMPTATRLLRGWLFS
jgi:antibiotic biosynthesis monooxygenase (ABM) superfamily enzyme